MLELWRVATSLAWYPHYRDFPPFLCYVSLTEDKLEDIVENEVLARGRILDELEALRIVHWALLLVDLVA